MAAGSSTPTAAQRAYAGIRDGIINATYPPGTMLSENEIAADLGMSRTPVRAALSRLQDEGWVAIYAQRGALVRDFTDEEMRESSDFLHALETAGVRRASPAARTEMAERLEANLVTQLAALKSGRYSDFAKLATELHRTFVEVGNNSLMLAAYDRLRDRQNLVIAKSSDRLIDEPDDVVAQHRALVEHARAGRWEEFSSMLYTHLTLSADRDGAHAPGLSRDVC